MTSRTGDLVGVLAWTLAAVLAVLGFGLGPGPIRTALALPLVVLFPGYALLAALFPGTTAEERVRREGDGDARATLSPLERLAFSVVLSLALVPMVGFVLNFTPFGIRLVPLMVGVAGLTVLLTLVGFLSRASVPEDRRHRLGLGAVGTWAGRYLSRGRRSLLSSKAFVPETETQRLFNVVFVLGILAFAASAGYTAITPAADQDPFTELYLVQQTDDGRYSSENLPTEYQQGETTTLHVGIGNHERRPMDYTVVVKLDGTELDRTRTRVGEGVTKRVEQPVTPTKSGDRLRLEFLLYKGDPPAEPSRENAYRSVHLWVDVN